ncbi:MAG: OmpA family protein [Bacteroidales bacterium]
MKKLITGILFFMFTLAVGAQSYSTHSKSAIKRMEKARDCLDQMELSCAEESLLKAIKADPEFVEALQLLAQVCYDQGRIGEAIDYYRRSLEVEPDAFPNGYRILAALTFRVGDYRETLRLVDRFLAYPPEEVNNRADAIRMKSSSLFALEALEHPVPFTPENLGDSVNSPYNEYWPSLSVDESVLMFTVMVPVNGARDGSPRVQEDLYLSHQTEHGWSGRKPAGAPLNTPDNEGAQSITADGQVLYFTACNRRDGKGRCDIYRSDRTPNGWSRPVNLGAPVNSGYSEKHPAISADGRRLFFASDRPGGKGSFDLWVSTWNGEQWSAPVNLGDSVNTPWMEQSPFIHPDQQSLYFSSDGWPGMGQGDLFLTTLGADGSWKTPINLGTPINTYNDEIGLAVNAEGDRAFFASDRATGTDTDLYAFDLPSTVKPVPVSYMKGRVYDALSRRGLTSRMQLIDLATKEVVMETETHAGEGDFLLSLPSGRDYALNVSSEGYLFYSGHFTLKDTHVRAHPLLQDVPMERVAAGSRMVLNNIFFEVDSDRLQPASGVELDKLVGFLTAHPRLSVEIAGHTDSTGTALYNQDLSERRAAAVMDYLVSKGISRERIKATGYGDSQPVGDNSTEQGRALNRRTELRILQILPN